jgi:hypothetical protein
MSDQPFLIPFMTPDKARDIARAHKWLADSYAESNMRRQSAAALRESEWWLTYALTLEATQKDKSQGE